MIYAVFANPTDNRTLMPHLEHFEQLYGRLPEKGSLENYQDLEIRDIEAYIKYPYWEQEKKKRSKKYRYWSWRFSYDKDQDELICPEKYDSLAKRNEGTTVARGFNTSECINANTVMSATNEKSVPKETTEPLT